MSFASLEAIVQKSKSAQTDFWRLIIEDDMHERKTTEEASFEAMRGLYHAMKQSDTTYDPTLISPSGMAGGAAAKLSAYRQTDHGILNDFLYDVMEKALKISESNACMKRIVAAPTAGSCGVIPAVLLAYEAHKQIPEDELVKALYVAAGIGAIIATNASISGAEGGCQAEIGSASAMAAGALAFLEGGDAECITHAAALALKNMLGLTCDPVAGLVEVPCIKRNVSGAVGAITASQLSLAGIRSMIPPDEVIDSMRRIGRLLPDCLKETSKEGLASTPTAQSIAFHLTK